MTNVIHEPIVLDLQHQPTPDEQVWAADNLAHLPIVVCVCEDNPQCSRAVPDVREWEDPDGSRWRDVGHIIVGFKRGRFRVHLNAGAREEDLRWLTGIVERAKAGAFERHGWRRYEEPDVWGFAWSRRVAEGQFHGSPVTACTEPECMDEFHIAHPEDVMHIADFVREHPRLDVDYEVSVTRYDDPGQRGEWKVNVAVHDFNGTASDVETLVQHLEWMRAEAVKLNAVQAGMPA